MPPTRCLAISLLVCLLAAAPAAAQTVITFEEVPSDTALTHRYGDKGVHFNNPTVFFSPSAHSGDRALYSIRPGLEVFDFTAPIVISFDSGQRLVKLHAGTEGPVSVNATLKAFDAAGNLVAQDGPRVLAALQVKTPMEVRTPQPIIRRVEIIYQNPDGNETIDDLEFDGLPPPTPPQTPPVVRITSPLPDQRTSADKFTVQGTVTGQGLAPQAVIRVEVRRPQGSPVRAVSTYPVTLSISPGGVGTFSQEVELGLGPQRITVDAENTAGLRGSAFTRIDSLPDTVRARAEAQAATLGQFEFGSITRTPDCTYAVYANGAVAKTPVHTFVFIGSIFGKWRSLLDEGRFPRLGCPNGEARLVSDNGQAQDFAGGRLYVTEAGTFFVPPIFVNALDALGGDAGTGLPVSDPTSDVSQVYNTWLFQQFRRKAVELPSTLEIRGTPPRLYVERQAGDGRLFEGILRKTNPTIVQSFECTPTAGACAVTPPPEEPLFADAARFCNNDEFHWNEMLAGVGNFTPNPPEWVPIFGHSVQTPIWGVLYEAHLANGDNPFAHDTFFEPCPTPTLQALVNETICPSDWDLKLHPLPGYGWMAAVGRNMVQVEFERVHFQHQLVAYGDPTPGEMVFASGRFIVDCGHGPKFKTEIHPPSVYVAVRTATFNGRPATQADIWVNRFFPGGDAPADAVEFDIHPPPRPSPRALLGVSTPGDQTGQAVQVTFRAAPFFGPVRVRVTATQRPMHVTKFGEMKMRNDNVPFGFDGRLHVYWTCPEGGC